MPELAVIAEQLLAPVPGGTGRYTAELLRALAETAPAGWELTSVVSGSGDPRRAEIPGVPGPRVLSLPRRGLIAAWERGVPWWPGGDSVHAPTPLAPPRRDRRVVITVHDTVPWTHPDTLTPRGVAWHRRAITRAARGADALVVPTRAVATDLAAHLAATAPVHVIAEGATSTLLLPPDAEAVAARLDLPERYVLAIGTVQPRKGYQHLVRALAVAGAPDLPLLIVGQRGWGALDLPEIAGECGLGGDRVRLLGGLGDAELAVVLHRATVLAMPSLAEGFGLPMVEAMAAGVPVVHSDAPALEEVAGGAGVTAPRANPDALATALCTATGTQHHDLVAAGLRRARHFRWQDVAREIWRLHTGG